MDVNQTTSVIPFLRHGRPPPSIQIYGIRCFKDSPD